MGSSGTSWLLVAALMLSLALGGADEAELCKMKEGELQACQPAVTGPAPRPPTPACCAGLAKGDLPCLCSYLDSLLPALGVDRNLAFQLPSKCGLTLPPHCGSAPLA